MKYKILYIKLPLEVSAADCVDCRVHREFLVYFDSKSFNAERFYLEITQPF